MFPRQDHALLPESPSRAQPRWAGYSLTPPNAGLDQLSGKLQTLCPQTTDLGNGIFADRVTRSTVRQILRDVGPGLAVIVCHVKVRLMVFARMGVVGHVGSAFVETRRFDFPNHRISGRTRGEVFRDVGPGGAAIASNVDRPIVRARPDHSAIKW